MTHATLAFHAKVVSQQLTIILRETKLANDRVSNALAIALRSNAKIEKYHDEQAREILRHKRKARAKKNPKLFRAAGVAKTSAWDAEHGFKKSLRKPAKYDFSKDAN